MFPFIKPLIYLCLPLSSLCAQAWVVPPQFGITDASDGEEPDVVAVTYTTDWYDPNTIVKSETGETTYKRLKSSHDGLMVRNDMVLVNKPPSDITTAKPEKYSVVSELDSTGRTLTVSKIHSSGDFNILELNCQVKNVDIHKMGFGEVTHKIIKEEGIAATIYFRNNEGVLKRSVQPLVSTSSWSCDSGSNFCMGYLVEDWADQIRDDGPHGSPVFYNDANGVKKIIAMLRNDGWLKIAGGFNGKPLTYYTHLKPIDSLEDFIVRTVGIDSTKSYEWVTASPTNIPKGAFVAGSEGNVNFKLCSATINQQVYSGFIGKQFEDTSNQTYPSGCLVANGEGTVTVAQAFSVLRGRPDYLWVNYDPLGGESGDSDEKVLQASDTGTKICRSADANSQRIGWVKFIDWTNANCILVGSDGSETSTSNFQVLSPADEKPACNRKMNTSINIPSSDNNSTATGNSTGSVTMASNDNPLGSNSAAAFWLPSKTTTLMGLAASALLFIL